MRSRGFEVLEWAHHYLPSPADPTLPLVLSDRQARFVVAFYEVDEHGVYLYRRGALEAPKGFGKSPLGAVVALAEFAGPVAPAVPWVQVAGVSEDAAVSNVYSLIWAMLAENENKAAHELGIDLGRGRLFLKSCPGAKLEAVTSAWGSREGQRLTFGLLDESHQYVKSNGGSRLARVLRRNCSKTDGRSLELANAPAIGENSVAEWTEHDAAAGHAGILFDALRPSQLPRPEMADAELLELLGEVYAGCPWVDVGRVLRDVRDPDSPWQESLRFFFNVASSAAMAAVTSQAWDGLAVERELVDGERMVLGFDGSRYHDATALCGCTEDGFVFPVEILERPSGVEEWRVDRQRIERAITHMFDTYTVEAVWADAWGWDSELQEWDRRWPDKVVTVATNSSRVMPPLVSKFRVAVDEGRLSHDGDLDLRRHALNGSLKKVGSDDSGRGVYALEKAGPGRFIDALVASVLAFHGATLLEEPTSDEPALLVSWG